MARQACLHPSMLIKAANAHSQPPTSIDRALAGRHHRWLSCRGWKVGRKVGFLTPYSAGPCRTPSTLRFLQT